MPDVAVRLRADLHAAISAAGLNQAFVARALGLSQKHVSAMLTGKAAMSLDRAQQIARVCGQRLEIRLDALPEETTDAG